MFSKRSNRIWVVLNILTIYFRFIGRNWINDNSVNCGRRFTLLNERINDLF